MNSCDLLLSRTKTAKETHLSQHRGLPLQVTPCTNALVFVRSRRLLYTRKIIKSISNNRKNGQEPAKNPKPRFRISVCKNYLRLSYRSTEM